MSLTIPIDGHETRARPPAEREPRTERVTVGPMKPRGALVEDDDAGRARDVGRLDVAALHDAHAHRLEVAGRHHLPVGASGQRAGRRLPSLDLEVQVAAPIGERQPGHGAGGRDAWLRPQAVEQGDEEPATSAPDPGRPIRAASPTPSAPARCGSRDPPTATSRSCASPGPRRSAARSRAPPRWPPGRRARGGAPARRSRLCRPRAPRPLRLCAPRRAGTMPTRTATTATGHDQEEQHGPVERDRLEPRQAGGPHRQQQLGGRVGTHETGGSASRGHERALGHRAGHQPPARRAECGAHAELVLAPFAS